MSNALINERSPYLRQHARNPVDWLPWGEAAFEKARREDKPVFLSIGYSTCHWCHVMARESFENKALAEILNHYYVSVKVDREERPDIDSVYMKVCTALNGSGGWPLTVIMTPEQQPFFVSTYLPRESSGGRMGLRELLLTVADKWRGSRGELTKTAGELTEMVRSEAGTANQILEAAEQRIYAIRQGRSANGMEHISDVMAAVWETIKERQARGDEFPGLSTGLIDLDRRISGLNNSDLLILAARPGMGKTSLALNIGLEAGKHSGKNVAIFSLEMSREQLGMRLLSTESLIDNKKLITGRLGGEDEWSRAAMAVAALSQAKIYIDDDSSLSVADMNAKCRRIKDLGLVIIDYMQLMQSAGGAARNNENRQQVVSDISRALKIMAKELNVPVMCLSQLSRANESRSTGQRRPMLSDLRESGSIEQDADIVMFIYRESYYDDDAENPNIAECIVAKNRHGATGTVLLEWRPEFTTFRNLAQGYEEDEY